MTRPVQVTLQGGQQAYTGVYRVSPSGIRVEIRVDGVVLILTTLGHPSYEIHVPLGEAVERDPEDAVAREKVMGYLIAGWPSRFASPLQDWMEECEEAKGPGVWRRYLIYGQNLAGEMDSDVNRPLVEQEVTAWLDKQSPSPS